MVSGRCEHAGAQQETRDVKTCPNGNQLNEGAQGSSVPFTYLRLAFIVSQTQSKRTGSHGTGSCAVIDYLEAYPVTIGGIITRD
jgi:hypothetical protein